MNWNYRELLPTHFDPASRVWVYQSSRLFNISEALEVENMLKNFVSNWQSHGDPVTGYGNLFFGQFVVLMADEVATGVSGCSTDSSVRLIRNIEAKFGVQMFDRQTLAFIVKDKIQLIPLSQLKYAVENGFIDGNTLFFNNLVLTKAELENNWIVEAKKTWLVNRAGFDKAISSS